MKIEVTKLEGDDGDGTGDGSGDGTPNPLPSKPSKVSEEKSKPVYKKLE